MRPTATGVLLGALLLLCVSIRSCEGEKLLVPSGGRALRGAEWPATHIVTDADVASDADVGASPSRSLSSWLFGSPFKKYLRKLKDFKFDVIIISVTRPRHPLFLSQTLLYLYASGAADHAASIHLVLGDPILEEYALPHNLQMYPDVKIHSVITKEEIKTLRDDKVVNSITTWGRAMRVPDSKLHKSPYPCLVLEDDVMLAPGFPQKLQEAARDAMRQSPRGTQDVFIAPYVITQGMPENITDYEKVRRLDSDQPNPTKAVKYEFGCCTQSLFFSSGNLRRGYAATLEKWSPHCKDKDSPCGLQDMALNYYFKQLRATVPNYHTKPSLAQHMGALSATFTTVKGGRYHRTEMFPFKEKLAVEDPENVS